MMDALEQFSVEVQGTWEVPRTLDLGLHFGINTGLVIAGGLGTHERQEYSVMGDAVNLAARLEQLLDLTDRAPLLLLCVFRPETVNGCEQASGFALRRGDR